MKKGHQTSRGFTIVELLIVIVVIAILAAISIVAYNGIQKRAHNTAALRSLKSVAQVYEMYKATYGSYPILPNGQSACVGAVFKDYNGDGVGDCRNVYSATGVYRYSQNAWLDTELAKVASGNIASVGGQVTSTVDLVGPYAQYYGANMELYNIFYGTGASDCPEPTAFKWKQTDSDVILCSLNLRY